ncbi:hypothetical protein SCUCBS95973_005991 [Sporothrix curviconia]|uniref:6-phosphogluconolactonase n=1 Tax=Sporothrix curviconia TaxID=1260050 RepID=A0ABP0C1R2_9PEZI
MKTSILSWATLAIRQLSGRQDDGTGNTNGTAAVSPNPVLLIGGGASGSIVAATFDGTSFSIVANTTTAGTDPSWLLYQDPNRVYAVDENSNTTRLFQFNTTTNAFDLQQEATGSSGVVYLAMNLESTRMVGAAFGEGQVDVWTVSPDDGSLNLLTQIVSDDPLGPNTARQDAPHPHQALLENSGRFFVVNDLGTDTILVIDSLDDAFSVVNHVRVPDAGCGPRHGAFFPATGSDYPTNYLLVCEMLSVVEVFSLNFTGDGNLTFAHLQTISTFDPLQPPANATTATAAEIVVSADNQHAYVSNRNTGNATDSVAHFGITGAIGSSSGGDALVLTFVETISSGGLSPRMFSLNNDNAESLVFLANQDGALGLLAIGRDSASGNLTADTATAPNVPLSVFGAAGEGPQFVQQVPIVLPGV